MVRAQCCRSLLVFLKQCNNSFLVAETFTAYYSPSFLCAVLRLLVPKGLVLLTGLMVSKML